MLGWLKRKAQLEIIQSFEVGIGRFNAGLKGASSSEIGFVVAMTNHWRNVIEAAFKCDLDYPDLVAASHPTISVELGRMIRKCQKKDPSLATGLMVWLHTIRASQTPEIRFLGREMWGQLARGFPHVVAAANGHRQLTGISLDISGWHRVPTNLSPQFRSEHNNARVQIVAKIIDDMINTALHLHEISGSSPHKSFMSHPMKTSHNIVDQSASGTTHEFYLASAELDLHVFAHDGAKNFVSVMPQGNFLGAAIQASAKGRYMVRLDRPLSQPVGELAQELIDEFVRSREAIDLDKPFAGL